MNERIRLLWKQAVLNNTKTPMNFQDAADEFAELIVRECVEQCEKVAADADQTAKSAFVTNAGRMLHEGMWGGAKNCAAGIKKHFGVEP